MYFDTGILVKLLVREADSTWFEQEIAGHSMTTSELALVEIKAALVAKERAGVISRQQRQRAEAKIQDLIQGEILEIASLDHRVVAKSRQVIEACGLQIPLRSLDALHVATCDLAQEFPLCTTDARMHAAARACHIPVFPESLPLNFLPS